MARPQNPPDVLGAVLGTPDQLIRAQLRYDYSLIPDASRNRVQSAAVDIVRHGKRAQESLILIGERLLEIKEILDHGQFTAWCETEFSFTQRTAQHMMNVAQTFGGEKRNGFSLLGDATLYMLAAPSTPEAAREQVITEAEATGSRPSVARVKEVIAQHKPEPSYASVWQIESKIKGVIERQWPQGPKQASWVAAMRTAAKTPGSAFMHSVEKALDDADIEFRRRDLIQAINNVASQYEQGLRSQSAVVPSAPPPAPVAAAAPIDIPIKRASTIVGAGETSPGFIANSDGSSGVTGATVAPGVAVIDSEVVEAPAPVRTVADDVVLAAAQEAISAAELGTGRIRKPFAFDGAFWTAVGGVHGRNADTEVQCVRLHAPGEAIAPGVRLDMYTAGSYLPGTPVRFGRYEYVLGAQWMIVRRGPDADTSAVPVEALPAADGDIDDGEAAAFSHARISLQAAATNLQSASASLQGWHDELANLIDELTARVRQAVRELE
jgi:hypothetical protein